MDEVLSKGVMDRLLTATEADLIDAQPQAETRKGRAKPSGGWMHAPANLHIFAMADQRLTKIARALGMQVSKVLKVQAKVLKDSRLLILRPAGPNDLTAFEVQRYSGGSGAWINLFDLLAPLGIVVDSGYRILYDAAFIPKESPLSPGLVIDLDQPKERRWEGKNDNAEEESGSTQESPNTQQTAKTKNAAKTQASAGTAESAKTQDGATAQETGKPAESK